MKHRKLVCLIALIVVFAMLMSVEYCNDVLTQAGLPPLHQGAA